MAGKTARGRKEEGQRAAQIYKEITTGFAEFIPSNLPHGIFLEKRL